MTDRTIRERFIIQAMDSGFNRAAKSFSVFISKPVNIINDHPLILHEGESFNFNQLGNGKLYVLTTQIIGTFSGKSFLVFTEQQCEEIFKGIHAQKSFLTDDLKDALLLEIDNIISASVIAELANALNVEVYGDVPLLKVIDVNDLKKYIEEDKHPEDPASVIFTNTIFQFNSNDNVHPAFIWKLSRKIFDMIPEEKLSTTKKISV